MQARAIWTVGSANMATTAGEDMTAFGGDVELVCWMCWAAADDCVTRGVTAAAVRRHTLQENKNKINSEAGRARYSSLFYDRGVCI